MALEQQLNDVIGKRIKYIRKSEKKTLKDLSAESGLSIGYLSNLERNVISPTIDQLQKICAALEINITTVLNMQDEKSSPLIKANNRKIFYEDEKCVYELLSDGENEMEGISITMKEGADYERSSWGHNYDELGIVIKGKLSVMLLDAEYVLNPGDSIYIKKHTLHTFKNIGKGECINYWFYKKEDK